ncbi:GNAT family N-acetyltransferase [uncultured Arthrobacter sp.]|uniref:GNAT family N-acetyltransferase n=1 Tax=uncultured Arthrobacter sp. TaxID=114050 RepID=UPI002610A13D|nr:GNAT family N-acetyltransferase [uncultured Arthrobacter sp.]
MSTNGAVPNGISIVSMPYNSPDAAKLIEGLQDEYVRIYGSRDDTPVDADQFTPPRGGFAVGYFDGTPIAIGGWRLHDDGRAELKRMYVAEAHRGNGYSRAMLQWLERSAAAAGVNVMVLETNQQHPAALNLYLSAGYQPVPSFGYYADDPGSVYLGRDLRH